VYRDLLESPGGVQAAVVSVLQKPADLGQSAWPKKYLREVPGTCGVEVHILASGGNETALPLTGTATEPQPPPKQQVTPHVQSANSPAASATDKHTPPKALQQAAVAVTPTLPPPRLPPPMVEVGGTGGRVEVGGTGGRGAGAGTGAEVTESHRICDSQDRPTECAQKQGEQQQERRAASNASVKSEVLAAAHSGGAPQAGAVRVDRGVGGRAETLGERKAGEEEKSGERGDRVGGEGGREGRKSAADLDSIADVAHAETVEAVLEAIGVDPARGLQERDVAALREKYGPNEMPKEEGASLLEMFLEQFNDPLMKILLGAAGISLISGLVEQQ